MSIEHSSLCEIEELEHAPAWKLLIRDWAICTEHAERMRQVHDWLSEQLRKDKP